MSGVHGIYLSESKKWILGFLWRELKKKVYLKDSDVYGKIAGLKDGSF